MIRGLLQLGLLVAAVYAVLLVYVYFFQSRLIYFPSIGGSGLSTPADRGMAFEDVVFEATDGVRLHGWFISAPDERAVVLFFHGNAGDITHRLDTITLFHDLGLSTFIIDYRGYGRSEGSPSEQGTYADAEGAWIHLTQERGIPSDRIVVFGRSLGAAIGTWLAAQHRPAALVVEAAFISAPELARHHYWFLPVRTLARFRYDTRNYLQSVSSPVQIFHGAQDEIVPIAHGRKLFEVANDPKEFVELVGGHNDAFFFSGPLYRRALDEFLDRHLPRAVPTATKLISGRRD
ncbi:MAG: alpha/beta hydrolase [Gammaproteobacteria bacterium]|nr:alpha/beta hydrolase [Gammaproteobacteria bacterium]